MFLHVADEEWGENVKKKNWVEEVGEEKMATVFHTVTAVMIMKVEQVGFLCLFGLLK